MATYDVVLLTEDRYENPTETNPYIDNVLLEDRLVQEALERQGLRCIRVSWSHPTFAWEEAQYGLFRTTWDYFERFAEFSTWMEKNRSKLTFLNPATLIRWNQDKHYLQDLFAKGIHIPESYFIPRGSQMTLKALHDQLGWKHTVLKPTVSGAARHTYQLQLADLDSHESIFQKLIAQEDMLLQVFQQQVVSKGEVSLMVFGGTFSHAILKKAKAGDFRVQDDFGGTVHEYQASKEEIQFAETAVQACPSLPLYARVDMIWDNEGRLAVSELELIEPELWFRNHPPAADHLAQVILEEIK